MYSVTTGAIGYSRIPGLGCNPMESSLIRSQPVGGQVEFTDQLRIVMAPAASLPHPSGINLRFRVGDRADVVVSVAVGANGHVAYSFKIINPVNALNVIPKYSDMTGAAGSGDVLPVDLRIRVAFRINFVRSVTTVADRGAHQAGFVKSQSMHAGVILLDKRRVFHVVTFHHIGIGVTPLANLRDIDGVYSAFRIGGRKDVMSAMAIGARRDVFIARHSILAVYAFVIYVGSVLMTCRAVHLLEFRFVREIRNARKLRVTHNAFNAVFAVNGLGENLRIHIKFPSAFGLEILVSMAGEAIIVGGGGSC